MNIEELKEQARRHELREEWQKAFDLYSKALRIHDEDEPPDITLHNRVGDIQTRLGQINGAVEQYEKAVNLYLEAELPNNAIAICKKVLRNLPDRTIFFLRMGQIRASQGFLTDARQNFLTYAERQTARGDIESALNALVEFVEISPDDVEIRKSLAAQLEAHERTHEAVEHYQEVYRRLKLGDEEDGAAEVEEKLQVLAPDQPLPDLDSPQDAPPVDDGEMVLESTSLGGLEFEDWDETDSRVETVEVELGPAGEDVSWEAGQGHDDLEAPEDGEVYPGDDVGVEEAEEGLSLSGMEFGDLEVEESEESDGEEQEEEVEGLGSLPTFEFEGDVEEVEILPSFEYPLEEMGEVASDGAESDEPGPDEEALPLIGFEGGEDEKGIQDPEALDFTEELQDDLPFLSLEEEGADEAVGVDEEVEDALEDASLEWKTEPEEDADVPPEEVRTSDLTEDPAAHEPMVEEPSEAGDHHAAAARGDMDLAMERVRALLEAEPDDVELHQRLVEYAFRKNDQDTLIQAYLELAGCLTRTGAPLKAKAVYQQVLSLAPGHSAAAAGIQELDGAPPAEARPEVASSEEYVDLGSLILGDDAEKTTRWTVAADAPSGDEEADFAKMLGQFKDKVSEHVAADDVTAHHDLGTAYMEMGLFDEAIGEFQMALRASPTHLPTHEVMGRCWLEMGKPDMAVRALERALRVPWEVEDELIGIYYLMGLAHEESGNRDDAVEFYEKVFSLDINFQDVTERLRALR